MPHLTRIVLAATVAAAIAAPAASGRMIDFNEIHQPPTQDLRSPDARDATTPQPHVMVAVVPRATPAPATDGGGDGVAVGAGLAGLALVGAATAAGTRRARRRVLA